MGKTAPGRQKGGVSAHSRAARRATSPGIDTDKSLKDVKPPTSDYVVRRPSVLAVHQGAGVSKKSKSGRRTVMSAKARKRHEKGMDRAEAIMDKKSVKVEKSKGKARTVQERAKNWEELNKKLGDQKFEKENLSANLPQDQQMDEDDQDIVVEKAQQSLTTTEPEEIEEEIL